MDNPNTSPDQSPITTDVPAEARQMSMFLYLSSFVGIVIPLFNVIAPLILWLLKKEDNEFINDQGREVVNFQISIMLIVVGLLVLNFLLILTVILAPLVMLTGLLMLGLGVYTVIVMILGAIKAKEGVKYRTPYLNFRLIK